MLKKKKNMFILTLLVVSQMYSEALTNPEKGLFFGCENVVVGTCRTRFHSLIGGQKYCTFTHQIVVTVMDFESTWRYQGIQGCLRRTKGSGLRQAFGVQFHQDYMDSSAEVDLIAK